jgi:hypothetical protein
MRLALIDMGNGSFAVASQDGRLIGVYPDLKTAEAKVRELALCPRDKAA